MVAFNRLRNDPYFYQGPGIDEPIAMLRDENKNGRIEDAEIFIYTKDHLGSVKDITDLNGSLIQRYHYSAYGITKIEKDDHNRPTKVVENPYAYTSREFVPELGIYHYRERWYSPSTGRWLSPDSIGFAGADTNLYRYVQNRPTILIDPTGNLSAGSLAFCAVAIPIGAGYDLFSTLRDGVRLAEQFEKDMEKLNNEKNSCGSSSEKLKIAKKQQELTRRFQMESMANSANAFLPGGASAAALGLCLGALALF